ncbi:MAG: helix-turn-helix transcriptional regulator [Patescibacteria group bacterium]|nr:helix-turn-helix transcriptional regulator [Patescibacteria group bacterium]
MVEIKSHILVGMPYADRFNECLQIPGKSVAGLAKAMGVSKQAVYSIKRGETRSATAANNVAAAEYFGVNPDWLATGEGQKEQRQSADLDDPTEFMLAQYGYLLRQIPEAQRKLAHLEAVEALTKRLLTLSGQQPPATPPEDK